MLEQLVSLVKGQVEGHVDSQTDIPADKKTEVAKTTTASIVEGLKDQLTSGNLSQVMSLLSGGTDATASNGVAKGLESNVVSNLTTKTGISQGTAQKLAMAVIPVVIGMIAKKNRSGSGDSGGFNVGSLISSLTGGGSSKSSGGGITNLVGKLFK